MNLKQTALGILLGFGMTNVIGLANAEESQPIVNEHFKHVLLISIDGLHAIDLEKFIKNPNNSHSALAELAEHGVRYTNASTSKPSEQAVSSAPPSASGSVLMKWQPAVTSVTVR